MKKKALVSGGSGFIGSHLADHLVIYIIKFGEESSWEKLNIISI